jgi:hypothetical protein
MRIWNPVTLAMVTSYYDPAITAWVNGSFFFQRANVLLTAWDDYTIRIDTIDERYRFHRTLTFRDKKRPRHLVRALGREPSGPRDVEYLGKTGLAALPPISGDFKPPAKRTTDFAILPTCVTMWRDPISDQHAIGVGDEEGDLFFYGVDSDWRTVQRIAKVQSSLFSGRCSPFSSSAARDSSRSNHTSAFSGERGHSGVQLHGL